MRRTTAGRVAVVAAVCASQVHAQAPWTLGNTSNVTIDLLNLHTFPWGPAYRILMGQNVELRFTCSNTLEFDRVNQAAFDACSVASGSGGDTIPTLSSLLSASIQCNPASPDSTNRLPTSASSPSQTLYYMSVTNGSGTRVGGSGGPASGGICTTRGAKVAIELIPSNSPLIGANGAYSCAANSCPTTATCRYRPCAFGSCFPEQLVSAGTSCNDGNSQTSADQCNAQGECAGTAEYTVDLRIDTSGAVLNPSASTSLFSYEIQALIANLHTAGLPTSVTNAMQLSIQETFASTHVDVRFTLPSYRNYGGGNLSLAALVDTVVGDRVTYRGASRSITAVVAVSPTPTDSPTATPTAAPTGQPTTGPFGDNNAAASSAGYIDGLDNTYLYAVAAAVVVIVIVSVLLLVRRQRRRSDNELEVRAVGSPASTLNPTYDVEMGEK